MANKIDYKNIFNYDVSYDQLHSSMNIIAIDPSGNLKDGNGHIGIIRGYIYKGQPYVAENYTIKLTNDYVSQSGILDNKTIVTMSLIQALNSIQFMVTANDEFNTHRPLHVIIENYIQYGKQATQFKEPETYYVVKAITEYCKANNIPYTTPRATEHKIRFSDEILKRQGVDLKKLDSKHERDALRMFLYHVMFRLEVK